MITFLRGNLVHKGQSPTGGHYMVVDVHGVGYRVMTSERTFSLLPPVESTLTIHTSMIVREDAMQLVGFISTEERELYNILSSASGVGPKVALSLLSELTVPEIMSAIMAGEHKPLTRAKGVGPKLAQKIAIELKDKLSKWRDELPTVDTATAAGKSLSAIPDNETFQEAETVLLSLGYEQDEIRTGLRAVADHLNQQNKPSNGLSSEELLQQTLKWLATQTV